MSKWFVVEAKTQRWILLVVLVLALAFLWFLDHRPTQVWAQEGQSEGITAGASLVGRLLDAQGEPIHDAEVAVGAAGSVERRGQRSGGLGHQPDGWQLCVGSAADRGRQRGARDLTLPLLAGGTTPQFGQHSPT